jgi:hypothetical protein
VSGRCLGYMIDRFFLLPVLAKTGREVRFEM